LRGNFEMTIRKKLIEVALPLDAINRGCEQDKNRKTGHIRNLHKWFAPMPLPAWRAMLLASVIDDPGNNLSPEAAARERQRLFRLIEGIAPLDAFKTLPLMDEVRSILETAAGGELPTVVDPFCGGGSTIVEAQRLGFPTIASDLNPLPVLMTTALCRVPQIFRQQRAVNPKAQAGRTVPPLGLAGLSDDVRFYAKVVRERAWLTLARFYPPGPDGEEIFAWRWAWAVSSPNPAAKGALTPLVTEWTLSKSKREKAWVVPHVDEQEVKYSIAQTGNTIEPTAGRNSARCFFTGDPIPFEYLRTQGKEGRLRPQMFAMIGNRNGQRTFMPPARIHVEAALDDRDIDVPDVVLPEKALGFRVQAYGIKSFGDLFLGRQARALCTFSDLVNQIHTDILVDAQRAGMDPDPKSLEEGGRGARAYADGVATVLGLCVGRLAASNNILVQWFIDPRSGGGKATPAFRMQTISMVWDFVETNPFADSVGGWCGPVVESALNALTLVPENALPAEVHQSDARSVAEALPNGCLIATDPPYYANIGYADLSDFFYIWLRRSLRSVFPALLSTVVSPKTAELIAAPYRHGNDEVAANEYFRSGFRDVFGALAQRAGFAYPMSVIYAVKQQEGKGPTGLTGWEVFLEGLLEANLAIVATWPVRTTTLTRTRGLQSNALASAICVVCRPKSEGARRTSIREFLGELRRELQDALGQLQAANIAPVDLAQAAVGRGMAIFSKYECVLESDGSSLTVGMALSMINHAVDEVQAQQEADFDGDSRWALAWFDQSGFAEGEYGIAETLSKAKNTSIEGMVAADIVQSKGGKVRLLKPDELPKDWDPSRDHRLTVWEMVHQLIRALDNGEAAAAALVGKLGTKAEVARELAYRLYTLSERKKRAQEALAYNALVQSWPEIVRLARERVAPQEAELF
jgi:putative DNA methylase